MRGDLRQFKQGFTATIMAALLMAIVVGAVTAIHFCVIADRNRTVTEQGTAQLRLLVMAAMDDARARSQAWPAKVAPVEWEIPLPAELKSLTTKVKSRLVLSGDQIDVLITAKMGTHHSQARLKFSRTADQWRVSKVDGDAN